MDVMTTLFWMLIWLPQVLSAMSKVPQPVNLNLTSIHLIHMLKWQPGPETPPGVYYNVTVNTDKGKYWVPVSGCERVQHPLVCNLSDVFPELRQVYLVQVTAWLEGQASQPLTHPGFIPIKDTHMDLPLLTVIPCGRNLCVELQPPMEHLREAYETLDYKLKIQSNSADRAQLFKDTKSLRGQIVENLAPGRQYCVSVCFSDSLESKNSNYSQPVCAFTSRLYSADPWISAMLCLLVMFGVVVFGLLIFTGFICLRRRPLPLVLTSVHHVDVVLVVTPSRTSLSSLLNVKATLPSAAPLSPEPEPRPGGSSNQTSDLFSPLQTEVPVLTETHPSVEVDHTLSTHTDTHSVTVVTIHTGKEEEDSQDVNLLTLTFGSHEEEEEEHLGVAEPESHSASEEVNITLVQPSQTWDDQEVTIETVSCSADDNDDEEEEESGYMGRPCTNVLKNLL
ncbi:interferon alpha/beta receptor 2-like isoform X3 [Seriola dumerili]|uniref:interferon alpha/beta receptor 2-like isoform X3 n=1 Tax=Seriola dumerili TaxID=41447 RepID=UPI000BBF087C|nr:interferon alpha/beta receptor 2-like isoform X3 [Seriola dumerili]